MSSRVIHKPGEGPYVAGTRRIDGTAVAEWLGVPLLASRPLPPDRPGLVITARGPRLYAPGVPPLYWTPGLTRRRLRRGHDVLVDALGLAPGEVVLDCTLGLGFDAVVLARYGATVHALERDPLVLWFTADGLWRFRPDLARRIHVRHADAADALPALPPQSVDHVYLDPMFPAGGVGPNLAPLRALAGNCQRPTNALIQAARRVARRHVVLKLAPGEPAPADAEIIASKRVRYARW